MKLALIPPFARLTDMMHTDYQLCLAHILAKPGTEGILYAGAFLDAQERGDYIILDNGAFEGSLVTGDTLVELANQLRPSEIVIPDRMRNAPITMEMAQIFHRTSQNELIKYIKLQFVIQGSNYYEMTTCAEWAMKQDWIDTIAVPKHTLDTCNDINARLMFARHIKENSDKEIHFLGASPLWTEEYKAAQDSGIVRGMDTSMPYVYGFAEKFINEVDMLERKPGYFTNPMDATQHHFTTMNVKGMVDSVIGL